MNVGSPILGGAAIPGDPDGLRAVAARLQAARDDVSSVQGRVASNELSDWIGSAGDAFRSSLNKLPGELGSVAGSFDGAASAINGFAGQLAAFQEKAAYYADRIETLEQELAAAQHRHDEAQSRVQAARLREAAAHDPISLKTAADAVRYGLSLLHLALDDLDLHSQEITRLQREAQVNREDYEDAVRGCCSQLQDASDSCTHPAGSSHISVSSILGGIGLFWARGAGRVVEYAEDVYDGADDVGKFVEDVLPVSRLGRWAVPIVDVAENPAFKGLDDVFTPLAIYGDARGLMATADQTRGESGAGRVVTMLGAAGTDAAMFWPAAGVANFVDGGALNASGQGLALILGGAASGGLKGALQGDDQFADNAHDGQYGWFVKEMAKGEDAVIEHPGEVAQATVRANEDAAGDVAHAGASAVEDAAHADEDAAKDVYRGAARLIGDL
jgi:hypothetical protein